jgi:hypothetical protein
MNTWNSTDYTGIVISFSFIVIIVFAFLLKTECNKYYFKWHCQTLGRCYFWWRDFCPTDVCPTDICPTVRPPHLSDSRTHRHLSNPRLKMRRLSNLYINRTFFRPQHLSDLTFVRPKAKKWHLSDLDVCPTSTFVRPDICLTKHKNVCLPICPSICPSVCLSVRLSVSLSVCPFFCSVLPLDKFKSTVRMEIGCMV